MKAIATTADQLNDGGRRLDASYHASDGVKAWRFILQWSGSSTWLVKPASKQIRENRPIAYGTRRLEPLEEVCVSEGIFIPGRFKRFYVDDPEYGEPWLSPSDMLQAELSGLRLVSRKLTPSIETLRIHRSWILLSRSGTIGNVAYARQDMDGLIGSDDIIRIVADPAKILPGYLYAFLSSPLGKALIEQRTYGSVVPHIEAHHVKDLPIPRLESATEQRIHELIEQAAALRVEASRHKQEALDLASSSLGVDLSDFKPPTSLLVLSSRLNWRLEAAYHATQRAAENILCTLSTRLVLIGDLLLDMFYLGKLHRVFVDDPQYGVPLLSIADAQKSKLTSDKFVSQTQSRNVKQAMLQEGWVLVSRTGTPGLVTYVRREMLGMAGTDHLVRLVPNEDRVLSGYLYTILSSAVGQGLLLGSVHGSVQPQLPPEYIACTKIPLLSMEDQRPIHDLITRYAEALTCASEFEDEARALLYQATGYSNK